MDREQEQLIKRIAYKIYRRYCPKGEQGSLTLEDLIHYGVIGLLEAKKRFNPERNVPFNAYAAIRINGEIMTAVRQSPFIRTPQKKRKMYNQLNAAKKRMSDRGQLPEAKELAHTLGWDEKKVMQVENLSNQVISADTGFEGHSPVEAQTGKEHNLENKILQKELGTVIQRCIESISETKERIVFIARQMKNMTLKQVSLKMGWSIEKTRQTQIRAEEDMKACLETNGWDMG